MKQGLYGQYKYRMSKELGEYEPEDIRIGWLLNTSNGMRSQISERDMEAAVSVIAQERAIQAGAGIHLFLSKDTADVVRNSVRGLTEPEMTTFVPEELCGILYVDGEEPSLFECTGRGTEAYVRMNLDDYGVFTSHARQGEEYDEDHSNMTEQEENTMNNRMRLLYGVFMMMKTFPEVLADGPPDILRHPAWYRRLGNKRHICINRVRGSVAPHIRSGHFRVLRSAYYKHKRGQAVFVKATMVKGKAKHDKKENK